MKICHMRLSSSLRNNNNLKCRQTHFMQNSEKDPINKPQEIQCIFFIFFSILNSDAKFYIVRADCCCCCVRLIPPRLAIAIKLLPITRVLFTLKWSESERGRDRPSERASNGNHLFSFRFVSFKQRARVKVTSRIMQHVLTIGIEWIPPMAFSFYCNAQWKPVVMNKKL